MELGVQHFEGGKSLSIHVDVLWTRRTDAIVNPFRAVVHPRRRQQSWLELNWVEREKLLVDLNKSHLRNWSAQLRSKNACNAFCNQRSAVAVRVVRELDAVEGSVFATQNLLRSRGRLRRATRVFRSMKRERHLLPSLREDRTLRLVPHTGIEPQSG